MINLFHINNHVINTSCYSNLLHDKIVDKFEQTIDKHLSGQTGCKNCISDKKKKQNLI